MNKAIKATFISLLIIIALYGLSLFISFLTNGYESVAPIYITQANNVIKTSLPLTLDKQTEIEVKSAGFKKDVTGFTVQIMPNKDNDFGYTVNGITHKFGDIESLNEAFDIQTYESSFTLTGYGIKDLLIRLHGTEDIGLIEELEAGKDYFIIIVERENGIYKTTAKVSYNVALQDVELDPDKVVI